MILRHRWHHAPGVKIVSNDVSDARIRSFSTAADVRMTGETQFNTLLKLAWYFWWTNSVFSCRIDIILLISSLFSFLLLLRGARWDTYSVKMSPLCSFAARTQVETSIGWLAWALGSCVCSKPLSTSACASFVSLSSPPVQVYYLDKTVLCSFFAVTMQEKIFSKKILMISY